jgi:hypothetical protein
MWPVFSGNMGEKRARLARFERATCESERIRPGGSPAYCFLRIVATAERNSPAAKGEPANSVKAPVAESTV